jgi:hypothetical protein
LNNLDLTISYCLDLKCWVAKFEKLGLCAYGNTVNSAIEKLPLLIEINKSFNNNLNSN